MKIMNQKYPTSFLLKNTIFLNYVRKFPTAAMNEFFLAQLHFKELVSSNFSKLWQLFEENSFMILVHNSPITIVEKIIKKESPHHPFPQFPHLVHRVWQTENLWNSLLWFTQPVKPFSSIITVLFCLYEFSINWRHDMTSEASPTSSYTCQCCL